MESELQKDSGKILLSCLRSSGNKLSSFKIKAKVNSNSIYKCYSDIIREQTKFYNYIYKIKTKIFKNNLDPEKKNSVFLKRFLF